MYCDTLSSSHHVRVFYSAKEGRINWIKETKWCGFFLVGFCLFVGNTCNFYSSEHIIFSAPKHWASSWLNGRDAGSSLTQGSLKKWHFRHMLSTLEFLGQFLGVFFISRKKFRWIVNRFYQACLRSWQCLSYCVCRAVLPDTGSVSGRIVQGVWCVWCSSVPTPAQ